MHTFKYIFMHAITNFHTKQVVLDYGLMMLQFGGSSQNILSNQMK